MFDSFISLGWFCGTASSMSRYGLREFSGPFDWCFSELQGIIHFINNDFSDFLQKDNLKIIDGKPTEFIDIKWGLHFNHEIQNSFQNDYNNIYQKYQRRIKKFRKCITNNTVCFLRAIRDTQEINYIMNNHQLIMDTIMNINLQNDIIFLIPQYLHIPNNFPFKHYMLDINIYQGDFRTALRSLFDTNLEFIQFCQDNYLIDKINENKVFDLEKEFEFYTKGFSRIEIEKIAIHKIDQAYKNNQIFESRYNRLMGIARCDFGKINLPTNVVIYGAGDIGKLFCDKITPFTQVKNFIDSNPTDYSYNGIPIVNLINYIHDINNTIIVVPTYDYKAIKNNLTKLFGNDVQCTTIEDIIYSY